MGVMMQVPDLATFTQVSESSGKTALNAGATDVGLIKSFWVGTGRHGRGDV